MRRANILSFIIIMLLLGSGHTHAQQSAPEIHSQEKHSQETPLIDKYINGQELTPLTGQALEQAFAGQTYAGTYKQVREKTGTTHFKETTSADGTTQYEEGPLSLNGVWAVIDRRICYQYDSEEVPGLHCFTVFMAGTCLYSYNPDFTTKHGPINANYWSVKSIREGDVSTCDDLLG